MFEKYNEYNEYCENVFKVHPEFNAIAMDLNKKVWMYIKDCIICDDMWCSSSNDNCIEIATPNCTLPPWRESKRMNTPSTIKLPIIPLNGMYCVEIGDVAYNIANVHTLVGFDGISIKKHAGTYLTFADALFKLGYGIVPEFVWIKK